MVAKIEAKYTSGKVGYLDVDVKINRHIPGAYSEDLKKALLPIMKKVATFLEAEAVARAPIGLGVSKPGGDLMRGVHTRNVTYKGFELVCDVPYAIFVEMGTGLDGPRHQYITAKHTTKSGGKGFMKFEKYKKKSSGKPIPGNVAFEKDGFIFTQMSRGMAPRPFLMPTVMQSRKDIERLLKEEIQKHYK